MFRLALATRTFATVARSSYAGMNILPAWPGAAGLRAYCSLSPDLFEEKFKELMHKLHDGLENMKNADAEPFDLQLIDEKLTLDLGQDGMFQVEREKGATVVAVTTPRSGVRTYTFSADSNSWEDTQDGHNMLELIARDVTWLRSGYPLF